ncbi:MarR family transcriptional regulator [Roseibium polysiphoniae]|uniref:MarR family transcriptional regulator n=1 Tax=Roseibium polysiphoniae TaxID=2571221 RepID=A0A944CFJ5_9HYPH|nr:MarR family winged helix-turn-helix transcriptional regulator [Roseibium polysiphoniae]MBS8261078.1 MarR family transcriptional regulator [Roseibium polysiphoniae]
MDAMEQGSDLPDSDGPDSDGQASDRDAPGWQRSGKKGPGFLLLAHCAHLLEERLRVLLKPLGLHTGQARVLHALNRMGKASQRQLADQFNVTPASMSQMTKRLINNGFIEVHSDPDDRRTSILLLTAKGQDLLTRVFAVWDQIDQIVIAEIGADHAEQLFTNSRNLRNALGGRAPGTKPAGDDADE